MSDDEVRDALIGLAVEGDARGLQDACLRHRAVIERCFASWKTVPESRRADQDSIERYVAGLLAVARFFAEGLGRSEFFDILTGTTSGSENPLDRWHAHLERAQTWIEEGRHEDAAQLLQDIVDETVGLRGSFVDEYLPVTLGMLGSAHFNMGRIEEAKGAMERALALSEASADADGITAYTGNLMEVHRYLGDGAEAARYARALADHVEEEAPDRARRLRYRAARMQDGEPKLRVVVIVGDDDDTAFELEELEELVRRAKDNDRIRFAFERDRVTLGASATLTQQGRAMADEGKPESALALWKRAMAIDPHDPAPHHERARLELVRQRWDRAVESLRAVESRAPGWPRVREDLALVQAIRDGDADPGLLQALHQLEETDRPARARAKIAAEAIEAFGDHPRLWLATGIARSALGETRRAREAFEQGLECADEPSVRTRIMVALAELCDGEEAADLAAGAAALAGDPVATAAAQLRLALFARSTH